MLEFKHKGDKQFGKFEGTGLSQTQVAKKAMHRLPTALLMWLEVVGQFQTASTRTIVRGNSSLTNNSIPHNISGLTNKTLDAGIDFSCEAPHPLKLPQSGVAGVYILSGLILLTIGKLFIAFILMTISNPYLVILL